MILSILKILLFSQICMCLASEKLLTHKISCHEQNFMIIDITLFPTNSNQTYSQIYLENYKDFANCQPVLDQSHHNEFMVSWKFDKRFENYLECGFSRLWNKKMNTITLYNTLVAETNKTLLKIPIKCTVSKILNKKQCSHKLRKRDALPADFIEDNDVEPVETLEQKAPEPKVAMQIKQNDVVMADNITVIPGTPLIMEIQLDDQAKGVYGLNVKFLEVSNAADLSETIIFRSCTVDPYLFENFNLTTSNSLQAKFRAFKFPNTAFVQFRANIQVCLGKCPSESCSHHQLGYGRRRRDLDDRNQLYDFALNAILRFNETFEKGDDWQEMQKHLKILNLKNEVLKLGHRSAHS